MEEISESSEGQSKLERNLGKFILWGVIALVGWDFYSTMKHDKDIAVQQKEIQHLKEKIDIDSRLGRIEQDLKTHSIKSARP